MKVRDLKMALRNIDDNVEVAICDDSCTWQDAFSGQVEDVHGKMMFVVST